MANSTKLVSSTRKGKSLRVLANLRMAASSSDEYPLAEMKDKLYKSFTEITLTAMIIETSICWEDSILVISNGVFLEREKRKSY